ncbi:hypothetical protein Tco_0970376 [Tanacetum coccineum]
MTPYPNFRKCKQLAAQIINKHEEHAFPTATDDAESSTSYQPPPDTIIGPAVYPPARQNPQPTYKPDYQFGYPQGKCNTFYRGYGEYHNSHWTLPPAWTESGVMLVLPADPSLWSDVISRWESITINRLNSQTWSDNNAKLAFVENLLEKLAVKLGKLYFLSTTEKLFAKLPPSLSKKIEESLKAKHPGLSTGVLPAIKFTHTFVSELKKYGIRKTRTYKGKPHNSHVKPFKRKYKDDKGRVKKSIYQELDLDDHWDIVLADFDDSSVYSISEGEGDVHQNISIMVQDTPLEEAAFMNIERIDESNDEQRSWKPDKELPTQSKSSEHDWKENTVINYTVFYYCGILTTYMSRLNCPKCQLTTCALCARNYLGKMVNVKGKQPHKPEEEKDFHSNEVRLLKELLKEKTEQVQQMIKDQAKEYYENMAII